MSNRAHRRPRQRRVVSTSVAFATNDADVEWAKSLSHDRLVESLGASRRSGVTWRLVHAADDNFERTLGVLEAKSVHTEFMPLVDAGLEVVNLLEHDYSGVRRAADSHPDGVLVIAMADAVLGVPR